MNERSRASPSWMTWLRSLPGMSENDIRRVRSTLAPPRESCSSAERKLFHSYLSSNGQNLTGSTCGICEECFPRALDDNRREPGEVGKPVARVVLVGESGLGGLALEAGEGSEVGVADQLADDEAPARLEDTADLPQGRAGVRDLAEHGGEDHGVHRPVLIGQRGGIALRRQDVGEAALGGASRRVIEELPLEVEDLDLPLRADPLGQVERVVAGA